jgi:hypothetical protein
MPKAWPPPPRWVTTTSQEQLGIRFLTLSLGRCRHPLRNFKDDFVFSQAEETFVEHELSNLADLIVERKKEKEIPINFIVQQPTIRRGFPGRIRGRNRFRPRRRGSLEKISESVAKTEIGLDKIVPGGMRSAPEPVVGRLAEDPDMRGKAVL